MAAKVKLGARPKDFKHTVTGPLPEGGEGLIEVTYVHRTQTEWGALIDEMAASEGVQLEEGATDEEKASMLKMRVTARDANARYIMRICTGWNLDVEFNRANVEQLIDELPGHAQRIMDDYRRILVEGRLGN